MKFMKYLPFFIVSLFLIGCVQQQVVQVANEPQQQPQAPQQEQPPTPVSPVPQPVEVVKTQPVGTPPVPPTLTKQQKLIQDFIISARDKIKSFKYIYRDPRSDPSIVFPFDGQYSVKGNLIKAIILTPDSDISARQANVQGSDVVLYKKQLYGDNYYDAIYYNTKDKTAIGVCEDRKLCPVPGKQMKLNYDQMYRKTPLDWLLEIDLASATVIEEKMIQSRFISKVQYMKNGKPVTLWIEKYSGLPIEVDYTDSQGTATTAKFENLGVNSVTDSDKITPIN